MRVRVFESFIEILAKRGTTMKLTPERQLWFRPKLDKELLELARRYKEDIIQMVLSATEESTGVVICRACLKIIPDSVPHVEVEAAGERYPFHVHEECQKFGAGLLLRLLEAGEVYWIHLIHACDEPDAGYNCEAGCFR
jgi:hypothetical protein